MNLKDNDYTLEEGAAWFTVKGFSIRITSTDSTVEVDIYKEGEEMSAPIASTGAHDSDIETIEGETA